MRKTYLLLVAIIGLLTRPQQAGAQLYSFSYFNTPYVPISGGTPILSSFNDSVPLGFSFNLRGVPNNKIQLTLPGNFTTGPYSSASDWFNAFGAATSSGQYSYQINGNIGNRIVCIQFKNATFDHEWSGTSKMNFQIWLYETDDAIEVHFGNSTITDPFNCYYPGNGGPFIGFNNFCLLGSVIAPGTDTVLSYLSGTPPNGMVYRFEPMPVTTTGLQSIRPLGSAVIFPNPASTLLNISVPGSFENVKVSLWDMAGHCFLHDIIRNGAIQWDTKQLPAGVYLVKVNGDSIRYHQKILIGL